MSAFKRISKSDVVTVPYVANKQWDFSHLTINSSSIFIYTGTKMTGSFSPATEAMTVNSQYQRLVYDSINHQFYPQYSDSVIDTTGLMQSYNYESASMYGATSSYIQEVNMAYGTASFPLDPGSKIAVLSIPTSVYGDSLSPKTFVLSSSAYYITDDGYGNLKHGSVLVGNIFYEQGVAVITNQDYQTYFQDTTTTVINWSNSSMPQGYFIDSNLRISINGQEKVLEYDNNSGRFTANVGDVVKVESWSDGTWPSDGTASLQLLITNQAGLSTSESGAYLTSSFTIADQTPLYVNSFTAYTPAVYPYTIVWQLNEYQESGSVLLDDMIIISSQDYTVTYLQQTSSGTGVVTIPAGGPVNIDMRSVTTEGSGSLWGPYTTASIGQSLYLGSTLITSSQYPLYKNTGTFTAGNLVTLTPGATYNLYASTSDPVEPPPPATIYWRLLNFEDGSTNIDGNLKVQSVGGGTTYLDRSTVGSGSFTLVANTQFELVTYALTNEGLGSSWGPYVSASLVGSVSSSTAALASSSLVLTKDSGTASISASPYITVESGQTYYINVASVPPAIVNWNLDEYTEGGAIILDANFRIYNADTSGLILEEFVSNTGSLQIPAGTSISAYGYSFTNEGGVSYWGPYTTGSLTASISSGTGSLSYGSTLITKDNGTMDVTAQPSVLLLPTQSYNLLVTTNPGLYPISMSFSAAAVGGVDAYVDNQGIYNNGVTGPWFMSWDRTLLSGELQPEDSTYAPFGYDGVPFIATSVMNGLTTTWGAYTSADTVIEVYEDDVLIRQETTTVDAATHPSYSDWNVYVSASFTPVSGSTYVLHAYNTNLIITPTQYRIDWSTGDDGSGASFSFSIEVDGLSVVSVTESSSGYIMIYPGNKIQTYINGSSTTPGLIAESTLLVVDNGASVYNNVTTGMSVNDGFYYEPTGDGSISATVTQYSY